MSTQGGIYAIQNLKDGRVYIGSAIDIRRRWRAHQRELERGKHQNPHLQRAWNKYGAEVFRWLVIEGRLNLQELLLREQKYLNQNVGGYNLCLLAGRGPDWTGRKRSEEWRARMRAQIVGPETRAKLSLAMKQRAKDPAFMARLRAKLRGHKVTQSTKEKLRAANLGRRASTETRAKLSAMRVGRKLPPFTAEHRERIRLAGLGRKQTPETCAKRSAAMKGRVFSPEHLSRLRIACNTPEARENRRRAVLIRWGLWPSTQGQLYEDTSAEAVS